jgi:hypothetical protein
MTAFGNENRSEQTVATNHKERVECLEPTAAHLVNKNPQILRNHNVQRRLYKNTQLHPIIGQFHPKYTLLPRLIGARGSAVG